MTSTQYPTSWMSSLNVDILYIAKKLINIAGVAFCHMTCMSEPSNFAVFLFVLVKEAYTNHVVCVKEPGKTYA